MPITYNEATDIWELTDPTESEKKSLIEVGIERIYRFFGEETGRHILDQAESFAKSKELIVHEAPLPQGAVQTGEVGHS